MRGKTQVQQAIGERIATNGMGGWMPALIGFGVGIVFGPTILAATRQGAQRMAEMAEEKLKKGK